MENKLKYEKSLYLLRHAENPVCWQAWNQDTFDLAVKELCSKYFGNLIEIAIGESENVRKKPAPDSVLRAIKELNSKKEFCIYSGDSDVDVQTARNTGIDCIGVTWGFRDRALLEQEGAKYIINKPFELIETINKINSCN